MKIIEYFELANRTLSDKGPIMNLEHARFGYKTEIGEALDAIKRNYFYGKPFNLVNFFEEMGDILWYTHVAFCQAKEMGIFSTTSSLEHLNLNYYFDKQPREFCEDMFEDEDEDDEDDHTETLDITECLDDMLGMVLEAESETELADGIFTEVAQICTKMGIPLEIVMNANIAKLAKRYPDKFNDVSAYIRDLSKEEKILETAILPYVEEIMTMSSTTWVGFVPKYRSL